MKERTKELIEADEALQIHSLELEESNAALKVLLSQREKDQEEFANNMLSNVKHLVQPYLRKVQNSPNLAREDRSNLTILESNLNRLVSPFSARLSS